MMKGIAKEKTRSRCCVGMVVDDSNSWLKAPRFTTSDRIIVRQR